MRSTGSRRPPGQETDWAGVDVTRLPGRRVLHEAHGRGVAGRPARRGAQRNAARHGGRAATLGRRPERGRRAHAVAHDRCRGLQLEPRVRPSPAAVAAARPLGDSALPAEGDERVGAGCGARRGQQRTSDASHVTSSTSRRVPTDRARARRRRRLHRPRQCRS